MNWNMKIDDWGGITDVDTRSHIQDRYGSIANWNTLVTCLINAVPHHLRRIYHRN